MVVPDDPRYGPRMHIDEPDDTLDDGARAGESVLSAISNEMVRVPKGSSGAGRRRRGRTGPVPTCSS